MSPGRKIMQEEKKEQAKFMSFGAALGLGTTTGLITYVPPAMKNNDGPTLAPGQHPDDLPKKRKRNRNKKEPTLEA